MGENIEVSLYVADISTIEGKRLEFLEKELEKLNKEHPIDEEMVFINSIHKEENEDYIKVGFFVRNATSETIVLNMIPVKLLSSEKEVLKVLGFKLKKPIRLPAYKAFAYSISIDKASLQEETAYIEI